MVRFPIVVVHGLGDFNVTGCSPTRNIEAMLRLRGIQHLVVTLPPFGSVQARSSSLAQQVQSAYLGQTVHIIAQSMGGVDARALAARGPNENGFYIRSITTFGTPHHGVRAIDSPDISIPAAISALFAQGGGLNDLSESAMTKFNNRIPNDPSVYYFSWAAQLRPLQLLPVIFVPAQLRLAASDSRPSDGLVTVESATWGTHLGTITGEDHISILNSRLVEATFPHLEAAENWTTASIKQQSNITRAAALIENTHTIVMAPSRVAFDVAEGLGIPGTNVVRNVTERTAKVTVDATKIATNVALAPVRGALRLFGL